VVDILAYLDFLPEPLLARLAQDHEPVPGVPGLKVARGLQRDFPTLENPEVLALVAAIYRETRAQLDAVLTARKRDRALIDAATLACVPRNIGKPIESPDYATAIGLRDPSGRLVIGPRDPVLDGPRPDVSVAIPPALAGDQVTLFGPPDSARLAINAMNAIHRRRPDEPDIVAELVAEADVPRWGADSEDSKTPRIRDLLLASVNLAGCFDGSLRLQDERTGKVYALAPDRRSIPIKRVAGLALPDGHHLLDGSPLPLHLVELVQHAFLHASRPEAMVFYFPKLENEGEAAYLATLFSAIERHLIARDPSYAPGTIRVLVVFENPRAIFRIREIAAALSPFFLGGSLGWHDFLASTARLFKHDPGYRIPVKADPNIVIHHICESHRILARELGGTGAMKLGGMYGVLFSDDDPRSFRVSMVGFIRDVITQLKRGLDGFWVAHPDFVRIGLALVRAWRRREKDPADPSLGALIAALVTDPVELAPLMRFVEGPDVHGLSQDDPRYLRAVLAAELGVSEVIANDDPEEVRYNVFQALQYLADWLSGNGCVALPATLRDARGESVFVRIMDDLATTERSRWELWAEVHHGRVSRERFAEILAEEVAFLREGRETPTHRPQVKWQGEAARWYPIAVKLLQELVLSDDPPEFATELLLPFTFDVVREAEDPWAFVMAMRANS
jgi:malate synthase